MGLFGHGNVNQQDGWSWSEEVKQYRERGNNRKQELKRHTHMLHNEVIRHPERFPHLKSTYERGMDAFNQVKIGTPAMGNFSRLESIESSRDFEPNPILNPGDGEFFHYNKPPPRNEYNPVLQRFPDEVDTGNDIMNEMDDYDRRMEKMRLNIEHQEINKQMQPHPPDEHSRQSQEYFKARERHERTKEWMPGRPKGGRQYREVRRDPILKDDLPEETIEENTRVRDEYEKRAAEEFNKVFQVYPNPRAQVRADREWMDERDKKIKFALHKRMVREGGYDPITLRDRRTGDSVGPLPEKVTQTKAKNAASMQAELSRTGANVAYALGSDRYGDPEGGSKKQEKVNIAQIDHVAELMENEARVESGLHDLEEREITAEMRSNVQKLMDARYVHQFQANEEIATTVRNRSFNDHINKAMERAGSQYHNGAQAELEPKLNTKDLLHDDLMTTWAPRVGITHHLDNSEGHLLNQGHRQETLYGQDGFNNSGGAVEEQQFEINSPRIPEQPIRLWPESKKEISGLAARVARAEKGV